MLFVCILLLCLESVLVLCWVAMLFVCGFKKKKKLWTFFRNVLIAKLTKISMYVLSLLPDTVLVLTVRVLRFNDKGKALTRYLSLIRIHVCCRIA